MSAFGDMMVQTAKANADLSAKEWHFVRWSAAATVDQASLSSAEDFAGVLQNKPNAANRHASVAYLGVTKIVAGGSITVNDLITTNGSGRAAAAGSGDMVAGRALTGAGGDGDVINMVLNPYFTGDLA